MIIFDTNIVSEMMRRAPDPAVATWVRSVRRSDAAVTAVTIFELHYGRNLLPPSERRREFTNFINEVVNRGSFGQLLSLEPATAQHAASFQAKRRQMGRPVTISDCLIAGHVLEHGAVLATRNVRDFDGVGLFLINPWEPAS